MEKFVSVSEAAKQWKISPRRVQILCNENRINGAKKQSGIWLIPYSAKHPIKITPGKKTENKSRLKVLSLFSGCGGMDLGFEGGFSVLSRSVNKQINPSWSIRKIDDNWVKLGRNRFDIVFADDIKPEAKSAWTNYFCKRGTDKSIYYLNSVVDLVKLQEENHLTIFPEDVDVVIGGFPCQDFSVAGKRLGFNSETGHDGKKITADEPTIENRGHLYMWMREVISLTKPKIFVAENVKGLTNLRDTKEIIEHDFANACDGGYLVVPAIVLNAAEFGTPQGRERVIFLGFNKSKLKREALEELQKPVISEDYNPYPKKTHYLLKSENNKLIRFVSTSEALIDLPEPDKASDINQQKYSKAKYMGKHCQGQTEIKLDGIGPTIRSEHHGNIEYRRLSKEHGGVHLNELSDGLKERRLTIRECARLQTFPDDYSFILPSMNGEKSVSASEAYKIIGNAVPPLLAYNIAHRLQDNWELYFGE